MKSNMRKPASSSRGISKVELLLFLAVIGGLAIWTPKMARESIASQAIQEEKEFSATAKAYAMAHAQELMASESIKSEGVTIASNGDQLGQSRNPTTTQLKALGIMRPGLPIDGVIGVGFEPAKCNEAKTGACAIKVVSLVAGRSTTELIPARLSNSN